MKAAAGAVLTLALMGCMRGGPIGEHRYPPKPDDAVIETFLTKPPTRPYEEIGYFRNNVGRNPNDVITWAHARARTVGGDAVIVNMNAGMREEGGNMADVIVLHWTDEAKP